VPIASIDEWMVADGGETTALITGVGRSRRVLLSSEIVRRWSQAEIAVVVAHELAHHAFHDLWSTLALNVALLGAGLAASQLALSVVGPWLGVSGPGELSALPLIALVTGLVWTCATPVRHAQSRRQERRADLFALTHTGAVDAFRATIRRLGARYLAEERPSRLTRWLHHAHPSVPERLEVADRWDATSGQRG
jgi:STE24 endopeptidase